jgi:hypothetical protein
MGLVRLAPQDDVLDHREAVDELEMLVHHADAEFVGVVGVADGGFAAVHQDPARIGLVEAEKDGHEGRLAGSVLSQQGVDRALLHPEGHAVVGANSGKILGDVDHLDGVRH